MVASSRSLPICVPLDGSIPRIRPSLGYRVALLAAALVMVALPVVYLALVAGVAYAGWLYCTQFAPQYLSDRHAAGGRFPTLEACLLVAPALVGLVMVVFFLKPLLARRLDTVPSRELRPDEEPRLFSFVGDLCRAIGATMPTRILLDCRVDASAGPTKGFFSLLSRDLTLTIGLPLVEGLTLRQLAGVVAHELGHFGQGSALVLDYIVRGVNYWFGCIVYERDSWDRALADPRRSGYANPVRLMARFCVWLTRGVLWALMRIGSLFSFLLERQMEYNADLFEAHVAGSQGFAESQTQLELLAFASVLTQRSAFQALGQGMRIDNLPALIADNATQIRPAERQAVLQQALTSRTALFDSHPAPSDRIARALEVAAPGIAIPDGPATALFDRFEGLCREATARHFVQATGSVLAEARLTSYRELARRRDRD